MDGHDRAQVLVLFAVLIPVLLLLFLFALGLAAVEDVRAHASYALSVAARAGAREVEYADYGVGEPRFNAYVEERVKEVFAQGLALRPGGLGETPENVAYQMTTVEIGYGTPGAPWHPSFAPEEEHVRPTVAARSLVPVRVWMFQVSVPVVTATEVK